MGLQAWKMILCGYNHTDHYVPDRPGHPAGFHNALVMQVRLQKGRGVGSPKSGCREGVDSSGNR